MKYLTITTAGLSLFFSLSSPVFAGPNVDNAFTIFSKVCLAKPFNPDANLVAVKKIGVSELKEIMDDWWFFADEKRKFGGSIKKSSKGNTCQITVKYDKNYQESAQAMVNKVAKLRGYEGADAKKVKGVTRLKYRGGLIGVSGSGKKRKKLISIIISNAK